MWRGVGSQDGGVFSSRRLRYYANHALVLQLKKTPFHRAHRPLGHNYPRPPTMNPIIAFLVMLIIPKNTHGACLPLQRRHRGRESGDRYLAVAIWRPFRRALRHPPHADARDRRPDGRQRGHRGELADHHEKYRAHRNPYKPTTSHRP